MRVDDAEADPQACLRTNARGAAALARAADARSVPSLHISSDLVFDGRLDRLYVESDAPAPLNVYGRSKAEMERAVLALPGKHLVVRAAAFFGPDDDHNFAVAVARELQAGRRFVAAEDQAVTPTYVPDLVDAALDLLIDEATGLWHLTHGEAMSWAAFARAVASACGLDPSMIDGVPGRDLRQPASRPASAGLGSDRGGVMASLESALGRFAAEWSRRAAAGERRAA